MKNLKVTNYFTNYHMVFPKKKKLLYGKWLLVSKKLILVSKRLILVMGPNKNQ